MSDIIDEIAGPEEAIPGDDETTEGVAAEETAGGTNPEGTPIIEEEAEDAPEPQHVPLNALHEERARRQELQGRLDETIQKMGKMEALWEQLQKGEEAEQIPDMEDDPAGHLNAQIQKLQSQLEEIQGERTQTQQQQEVESQNRQMLEQYAGSVREFTKTAPDFSAAYEYLATAVDAELKARGISDPVERQSMMQYEEGMMVGRALQTGQDPAKLVYEYAKFRGYSPDGAAYDSEDDKLERLEEGQKAAASLSNANGRGEGVPSLERLAELDGDEFDEMWAKLRRQGALG